MLGNIQLGDCTWWPVNSSIDQMCDVDQFIGSYCCNCSFLVCISGALISFIWTVDLMGYTTQIDSDQILPDSL